MSLSGKAKSDLLAEEKKLKETANEFFAKGKYKKALPLFVQLSELNPKELRTKTKVGELLVKLDRKKEASEVYRNVAAQYAQDGMLIQAIAVNKMILQINPDQKDISKELSLLYSRRQKETGSAMRQVSTVIPSIQMQEVSETAKPRDGAKSSSAKIVAPFVISIEREVEKSKSKETEIQGRLIPFADAVDLGSIAEASLPPTLLFSALDSKALEMVLGLVERREFGCGQAVCKEGEAGDSIFIVSEGNLSVTSQDSSGREIDLSRLKEGDFFGEFGYFSDRRRHATVKAISGVVLLELKRQPMNTVVKKFPKVGDVLEEFYRLRLLDTLLAKSQIFQQLTPSQRQVLSSKFTTKTVPKGDFLMREGEDGHEMYLIQEGYVSVTTQKSGKTVQLAVLKEGNFCGEFSILTDAKRTADIICLTDTKVLRLSKEDARGFFQDHPELFDTLREIAEKRVQGTIQALSAITSTHGSEERSLKSMV